MATSDAQKRATAKYQKERVEEIKFRVPKGEKAIIQEYAKRRGESVNSFLRRAVNLAIRTDTEVKE